MKTPLQTVKQFENEQCERIAKVIWEAGEAPVPWSGLMENEKEEWRRAIEFDAKIRTGIHKVRAKCFVHRDCLPLSEVDLSTDNERGQGLLWGNECEGICGV